MILSEFSYRQASGWQLDKLLLSHQNLVVGMNTVGKSRTVSALGKVARFIKGDIDASDDDFSCSLVLRNSSCLEYSFEVSEGKINAEILKKDGERLTREYVQQNVGIDLEADPEKMVFHPAAELGKIYALAGKQYDKHASDIFAIMSQLTPDDFLKLIGSGKCQTFKAFAESLLGVTIDRIESL